jgi:hypothetical protein
MPDPTTGPGHRLEGVRTDTPPSLLGSRCPVCQEPLLRGRQTVCSGACRAKRWRQTHGPAGLRDGLLLIRAQVDDLLARMERRR